jgi:hypothetical protein
LPVLDSYPQGWLDKFAFLAREIRRAGLPVTELCCYPKYIVKHSTGGLGMLGWGFGVRTMAFGVAVMAMAPLPVLAKQATHHPITKPVAHVTHVAHVIHKAEAHRAPIVKVSAQRVIGRKMPEREVRVSHAVLLKGAKAHYSVRRTASRSYGGISCVPFARIASGIELKGNAANWWDAAAGVYARGQTPEGGSVLNFRATGGMRLGHVAVVTRVVNAREIEIDHANWWGPGASKGGVSRGIPVIDVSENNDWSEVRVGLGHTGQFGSVYPTYGFIYDRPDTGYAAKSVGAAYDEVAEAPIRSLR